MVDLINSGKIILDPRKNPHPVTYHDPCNLSRSSGITEEPRFCLKRACMDFREMTPNRSDSFCCTGGGGAMSMSEYAKKRLSVSSIKANQIKETGAAIVSTACHNCMDGLADVIKHHDIKYDFGNGKPRWLPVPNVCELVADAIVIPKELPERKRRVREVARPIKVLVIDDQPDIVAYLEALLQDNGYEVTTAFDGIEGVNKAKENKPDLITLDVTMPGKSGIAVFHELRNTPDLQDVPVFIVTGVIDFRQLMYQRTVEAPDGFMQKPINKDVFLMTVERLTEHAAKAALVD
jgi:CheY-like chemotaxis protein